MVHRREAQPVLALQGKFPVRLQLESQVGDGVRRRHPVPAAFPGGGRGAGADPGFPP